MRRWIRVLTSLLLAATMLAGCTSENEPQSDDVGVDTDPSTSAAPSVDPSVPDTGEEKNGTPDPTEAPQPEANVAPVAELVPDVTEGTVPFDVRFDLSAADEDGDELSWTLDVDGDGEVETEGTSLPADFTYTFDTVGDYTAVFSVTDGDETVEETVKIVAMEALPSGVHHEDATDDAQTPFTEIEVVDAEVKDGVLQIDMTIAMVQEPATGGGYASYEVSVDGLLFDCVSRYPVDSNPLLWDQQNGEYSGTASCSMADPVVTFLLPESFLVEQGAAAPYDLATFSYGGTFALALNGDGATLDDAAPDSGTLAVG